MQRFVFIVTKSEPIAVLEKAFALVYEEWPGHFEFQCFETGMLDADEDLLMHCLEAVKQADFVFFRIHGTITDFKGFIQIQPFLDTKHLFFHTGIEDENTEMADKTGLFPTHQRTILRYYNNADEVSMVDMLLYIATEVQRAGCYPHDPPKKPTWHGLYGVDASVDEMSYKTHIARESKPVVGLLVHWHNYVQKDLAHVDALISKLRELGAIPYCV